MERTATDLLLEYESVGLSLVLCSIFESHYYYQDTADENDVQGQADALHNPITEVLEVPDKGNEETVREHSQCWIVCLLAVVRLESWTCYQKMQQCKM